jgi:hypothetical protein
MLFSAMCQPDPSVDMMAKMMVEFQKSDAAAKEHRVKVEAAAEDRHLKVEERAQHMKLLEMLHDGKISREMYEGMMPSSF